MISLPVPVFTSLDMFQAYALLLFGLPGLGFFYLLFPYIRGFFSPSKITKNGQDMRLVSFRKQILRDINRCGEYVDAYRFQENYWMVCALSFTGDFCLWINDRRTELISCGAPQVFVGVLTEIISQGERYYGFVFQDGRLMMDHTGVFPYRVDPDGALNYWKLVPAGATVPRYGFDAQTKRIIVLSDTTDDSVVVQKTVMLDNSHPAIDVQPTQAIKFSLLLLAFSVVAFFLSPVVFLIDWILRTRAIRSFADLVVHRLDGLMAGLRRGIYSAQRIFQTVRPGRVVVMAD